MGVHEGRGQLSRGIRDLMNRWYETKSSWDDTMSRNFEKHYLFNLEMDLRNALGAMDHMAVLLQQVRHECSEDR